MDKYINPYYQNAVIRNKVLTDRKVCGFNSEEKNCEMCFLVALNHVIQIYVANACHVCTQTEITE